MCLIGQIGNLVFQIWSAQQRGSDVTFRDDAFRHRGCQRRVRVLDASKQSSNCRDARHQAVVIPAVHARTLAHPGSMQWFTSQIGNLVWPILKDQGSTVQIQSNPSKLAVSNSFNIRADRLAVITLSNSCNIRARLYKAHQTYPAVHKTDRQY